MSFDDKERISAFSQIESRYFQRNFGTMAKSDFETLLFHIYIEHLLDNNLPFDDYTMSKSLGISQSRVRTLKVRKQLQYPRVGFDWKKAFAECIKNAVYDDVSKQIKLNIPDVNVLTELRYFMECHGWYDEYQLNPKLFQCRLDFFVKLCVCMDEDAVDLDDEAREAIDKLAKKADDAGEKSVLRGILEDTKNDALKSLMLNGSKSLIKTVLRAIPFGGVAATAVEAIISIL